MKLANFRNLEQTGNSPLNYEYTALVDVGIETGKLWWKKTEWKTHTIHRKYAGFWFFTDTGEYTPSTEAEALERAYRFQHKLT